MLFKILIVLERNHGLLKTDKDEVQKRIDQTLFQSFSVGDQHFIPVETVVE